MTIKKFFSKEVDFTKELSENRLWLKKLYDVCGVRHDGDIETKIEVSSFGGRSDIYEFSGESIIEAQIGTLDLDHVNRGADYALCLEEQYDVPATNVIYLCDSTIPDIVKRKIDELNQLTRNFFAVQCFLYDNNGNLDIHFTLIKNPSNIKPRIFVNKRLVQTSLQPEKSFEPTGYNPSEPWRCSENLNIIEGIPFFGSVGENEKRRTYWIMYVRGFWVSSVGFTRKSANGAMKETRSKLFFEIYGEHRKPNLSFWAHHKDNDGNSIDSLLIKYFEESK